MQQQNKPRPTAPQDGLGDDLAHEVKMLLVSAYVAGCTAVHENYQEDRAPEFDEAGYDYAEQADLASLRSNPADGMGEELREILQMAKRSKTRKASQICIDEALAKLEKRGG